MRAVSFSWGDGEWYPWTVHGRGYLENVVNGVAGLAMERNESLSVRYDNGQLCTFRRLAKPPVKE